MRGLWGAIWGHGGATGDTGGNMKRWGDIGFNMGPQGRSGGGNRGGNGGQYGAMGGNMGQ